METTNDSTGLSRLTPKHGNFDYLSAEHSRIDEAYHQSDEINYDFMLTAQFNQDFIEVLNLFF
jgi:hypothetical protein